MQIALLAILLAAASFDAASQPLRDPANSGGSADPKPGQNEPPWTLEIYPILAWAPVFGASVSLPSIPVGGLPGISGGTGGTPAESGSTSTSFNGAALVGAAFYKGPWLAEFNALWAGMSASRTTPRTDISTQGIFGDAIVGYRVFGDVAVTAGVRRLGLKIGAQVGDLPKVHWKPGFWDPLVGLDWRARFGQSWTTELRLEGGGFGVGSDVDVSGSFRASWRFAHHFNMTFGYGALHYQNSHCFGPIVQNEADFKRSYFRIRNRPLERGTSGQPKGGVVYYDAR